MKISMIINAVLAIALVFLSYKLAVTGNDKGKEQDSSEVVLHTILKRTSIRSYENKTVEKEKIEKLGLLDLMTRSFSELSGGQQQRVLLARALMAGQRLMILDEPVTGLDPEASQNMYDIINELNKSNMTIIMISHDIKVALEYATKVLYIGEHIFFGTTPEYKKSRGMA